jgi:hypothetical protein
VEKADANPATRPHRGRCVLLTRSQQGMGALINPLVLVLLLVVQGATGDVVTPTQATITWHAMFAIGAAIVCAVSIYRTLYLEESEVWRAERAAAAAEAAAEAADGAGAAAPAAPAAAVLRRYGTRVIGTGGGWFIADAVFFGNRLFLSSIIAALDPGASVFKNLLWATWNSLVALVAYYLSALLIDVPCLGRRRTQIFGLVMLTITFGLCGGLYDDLLANSPGSLRFLYFCTTFFTQFGTSSGPYLCSAECYPSTIRGKAHGTSAAMGKIGGLVATLTFVYLDTRDIFFTCAGLGAVGIAVAVLFLPEPLGLEMAELDRFHLYLTSGQVARYTGEAVNPRHLSLVERWCGHGAHYDPSADAEQRELQELAKKEA